MIAIAIDGPSGAGKSTIAKEVAKRLGFIYVDTGALYRAIGYYAICRGISPTDTDAVSAALHKITVELTFSEGTQRVLLCSEDVSREIRQNRVSMAASQVSAIPAVRTFLFDLQRNIAKNNNVIMDGRDIGTVVLPFAQVKIFLTASPEQRAKRRVLQLAQKGGQADEAQILAEMIKRDYDDSNRAISPLKQAEDAITVDTTADSLDQSIDKIYTIVKERLH